MEYMTLVVFLLGALFVFKQYIINGFSGGWKKAGDAFGHGKQYDPRPYGTCGDGGGSLECFYDSQHCVPDPNPNAVAPRPTLLQSGQLVCSTGFINTWIDQRCYRRFCDCTLPPEDPAYNAGCLMCLVNCASEECGHDI